MSEIIDESVAAELARLSVAYQAVGCTDDLADTALFCRHYGYSLEQSANALLVCDRKNASHCAMCIVLAHTRLDTNNTARKKLGVRKLSFASIENTIEVTGMQLGGVTPIGLPEHVPVWVDSRVMDCEQIILGGGNRTSKIIVSPDQLLKVPHSEIVDGLAKVS